MKQSQAEFVESLALARVKLQNELRSGDVLLTLGAGDITEVASKLAADERHEKDNA